MGSETASETIFGVTYFVELFNHLQEHVITLQHIIFNR